MSELTPFRMSVCGCLIALTMVAVPGCSGCRDPLFQRSEKLKDIDEEEEKKKKEEQKPNIEMLSAVTVPGEGDTPGLTLVKPGHWTSVSHEVRANNFDINAEIVTATSSGPQGGIYPVENTQFRVSSSLPAPLPKGQLKQFETTYLIPNLPSGVTAPIWLQRELRAARGGGLIGLPDPVPTSRMPHYQYHFVVLAADPDRYSFLKVLPSFAAPTDNMEILEERLQYYRVLLPKIERFAPLPTHSLTWSTIAYLLWDDLDAGTFTEEQETALLDWLHWGGQLIVSGPNSLGKLDGSFLGPYLPARGVESREIHQADVDEINSHWSLRDRRTNEIRTLEIPEAHPLLGVRLIRDAEGVPLPNTAGLVCERMIGQGRIVVTAFSLADPTILRWGSYDSFMNACLLRRPRREFIERSSIPTAVWADDHRISPTDSRLLTRLRYFSRDVGNVTPEPPTPASRTRRSEAANSRRPAPRPQPATHAANYARGFPEGGPAGMAAWDDRSGAANVARESLRDAAGISVPRGEFVLQVLGIYLLVLAPLNWGIFRLMGRVEWAWAAAPLIAIVGAFAVIRFAQLDIGFARSITEVAVAEVQPGYPRAHVTRFAALYTSLSTGYDIEFEDPDSLVQPFSAAADDRRPDRDGMLDAVLRSGRDVTLSGFQVASNKTGIVHCEQFCDLGGTFQLAETAGGGRQLRNQTEWALRGAGVLRRTEDGRLEAAWLGDLEAGDSLPVDFQHVANGEPHFEQWDESATTVSLERETRRILERLNAEAEDDDAALTFAEAEADPDLRLNFVRFDADRDGRLNLTELIAWVRKSRAGEISLGQMVRLATRNLELRPGDARLVGWSDRPLTGRTIRPDAAQVNVRTLFLVHLEVGALPPPLPDDNALADIDDLYPQPSVNEEDFQ